jgi:hypothetical protein
MAGGSDGQRSRRGLSGTLMMPSRWNLWSHCVIALLITGLSLRGERLFTTHPEHIDRVRRRAIPAVPERK